jgi:hypothetical protein
MRRGAVVLTPFPFTDLSGQKVRPALVVSRSDRGGRDVLLAFITTPECAIAIASIFGLHPWPMDILVYTPEEVKRLRARHGTLLEEIESEGKVLFVE